MLVNRLLRDALALGLALAPAGSAMAQQGNEGEHPSPPQSLRFLQDGRLNAEQMEQFRRQFEQMQRRLPGNARVFRFNPEGILVEPGQFDGRQLLFQPRPEEAPVLGLTLRDVPEVLRSHLDLPEGQGVVVSEVVEDSPSAGVIEPNDILLRLGETAITEPSDLARALDATSGNTLSITLVRGGETQTVELDRPRAEPEGGERYRLGVRIETPDDAVRSQLDLPEGRGVIVMGVDPESPAQRAGIEENDILIELGGEPITGAQELANQVQEIGGESVELTLLRDGEETTIEVTPESVPAEAPASEPPQPPAGFRFFGPGVMIDPETGTIRPGTGPAQPRNFVFPGQPSPELERRLDEVLEQLKELREEVNSLKQSRPQRRDWD
jgi:membrane-associated protease RseP (regulator of RpoE activity)